MSDNPASPLLGANQRDTDDSTPKPRKHKSSISSQFQSSLKSHHSDEFTPLLARNDDPRHSNEHYADDEASLAAATSSYPLPDEEYSKKRLWFRWPTILALSTLITVILLIMLVGFGGPAVIEEYAKEAAVFEPTNLSIDSFTAEGVNARVQGDFRLDGSRVQKKSVRDLGRAGTWIARAIETKQTVVQVYLPEYGNAPLGSADIPPVIVSIQDGKATHLDIIVEVKPPSDTDGIRNIANDWMNGRVGQLRIMGKADVGLKSGIFSLGTQTVSKSLVFQGNQLPAVPRYNITKFNVHEVSLSEVEKGMAADVRIVAFNEFPVTFTVPPLGFDILVKGCTGNEPILLANATTRQINIKANENVEVDAKGVVRQLPDTLVTTCPNSEDSPLDALLGGYMHGMETTIFVRGAESPNGDTPRWISDLTKNILVPVPFSGHSLDNLIRDFSLTDVHFGMPNPVADPDSPDAQPKISATIQVLANLPREMNFPIDVPRVRASSVVSYKGKKLGDLDLHKWQEAHAKRIAAHEDEPPAILVKSAIKDAPLMITDHDVFSELVQALLFGGSGVILGVEASVDIETSTALGTFIVRDVPAEGKVPIKPLSGHGLKDLSPQIGSLRLLETTQSSLLLELKANLTNPTNYSATVPYVDINIFCNDTLLGHTTVRDMQIIPGRNENITIQTMWDPLGQSGEAGKNMSRELVSQYISGYNTTLTLRTHNGTIPSLPGLGAVLSSFKIEVPMPRLTRPKNPNHPDDDPDRDDRPRFIDDATMHLFSSTATFTLLSPLAHTTLYLTHINATAIYNRTEPIGLILYDLPFAVPPGATTSPRLPVSWSLGGVGYGAVKDALGGTLVLSAKADVGVRVGEWEETVWFEGGRIGAHVKI